MASLTPVTIAVPRVVPRTDGGAFSFAGVLKLQKAIDGLVANRGLDAFEVPRAKVPKAVLEAAFENTRSYRIPLSALVGPKTRGAVYAARMSNRPGQDHLTLFTPKGHRLAVRQLTSDYPAGFFWSNYQIR